MNNTDATATILYVDDEAMARKYFERVLGDLAEVLTAPSVEEGRDILRSRGDEIAVLVSDQRMPGEHGNELLRYARAHHPSIVRVLTTAYSELDEAIEAINSGEIYRYISKPWDLESLRADMRNALELASLRRERDGLVREKMMVQQHLLLGSRVAQLAVAGAPAHADGGPGLQALLETALAIGCQQPPVDWNRLDHADLMQAEARRGIAIGQLVKQLQGGFGSDRGAAQALAVLHRTLGTEAASPHADGLRIADKRQLTWVLDGPAAQQPDAPRVAWLAWLLWLGQPVDVEVDQDGALVRLGPAAAAPPPANWMAEAIGQLSA